MRLKTAEHRRVEHALNQLESRAAPRVRNPLQLDAAPPKPEPGQQARRAAVLAQLGCQLLLGVPAAEQPYPSQALHPRAAALFRAKALKTPEYEELEQQIASDDGAGKRIFGADWKHVAPVFGGDPANPQPLAKPKRRPLEAVDYGSWRRARWALLLASPEGVAAVESGRLVPSASDIAAESAATSETAVSTSHEGSV